MSTAPQDARGAYIGVGDRVIVVSKAPGLRKGATGTVTNVTADGYVDVDMDDSGGTVGWRGDRLVELGALAEAEAKRGKRVRA